MRGNFRFRRIRPLVWDESCALGREDPGHVEAARAGIVFILCCLALRCLFQQ